MNINIREDTVFLCGADGKRLHLVNGRHSLYYRCPNYERENRKPDEDVCMNRMSLLEQERMFHELEKVKDSGCLKPEKRGRVMGFVYEIYEMDERYLSVYVINKNKCR